MMNDELMTDLDKFMTDLQVDIDMENEMLETETLKKEFDELVRTHDLTYMYSDDHRYWKAGTESMKKITEMSSKLPREFVVKTWNKYVDQKLAEHAREQFYWKM